MSRLIAEYGIRPYGGPVWPVWADNRDRLIADLEMHQVEGEWYREILTPCQIND